MGRNGDSGKVPEETRPVDVVVNARNCAPHEMDEAVLGSCRRNLYKYARTYLLSIVFWGF